MTNPKMIRILKKYDLYHYLTIKNIDYVNFLYNNNVLEKYIHYRNIDIKSPSSSSKNTFFVRISIAFRWNHTYEGFNFWSKLNNMAYSKRIKTYCE